MLPSLLSVIGEGTVLPALVTFVCGAALVFLMIKMFTPQTAVAPATRVNYDYDAIIVGGSIAGPAVAKALSDQGRKVLLVERSLWEKPDRIVGELLQPGGMMALETLGMKECAAEVGSKCTGYMVIDDLGKRVSLPYRSGFSGVSFHFGDFVTNLRRFLWEHCKTTVTMVEGTVTDVLVEASGSAEERAYGVRYLRDEHPVVPKNPFQHPRGHVPHRDLNAIPQLAEQSRVSVTATAPVVILCDGGASKFKPKVNHYRPATNYHSNFIGLILEGVTLPEETRGHVFFGKTGPILSYRLDSNEVRFLVDYNKPELPSLAEQSQWLVSEVAPRVPESLRAEFIRQAKNEKKLRSMAIAQYSQLYPSVKGVVGIGDHANQRHPLTGGGMTCAVRDAIRLASATSGIPRFRHSDPFVMSSIQQDLQRAINGYCRTRFLHSSCINILSWALYGVFGAEDLRSACFDYFLLGGECVEGPMALLSGLDPNPATLLRHYVKVMLNGAWNKVALTGTYSGKNPSTFRILVNVATFFLNPVRFFGAIFLLIKATVLFAPLALMELVSIWRLVDPQCSLARRYRGLEKLFLKVLGRAKSGKPVGL